MLTAGRRVPAVDTGRPGRVYSPGGSNEWIPTALLILAGAGLLLWACRARPA